MLELLPRDGVTACYWCRRLMSAGPIAPRWRPGSPSTRRWLSGARALYGEQALRGAGAASVSNRSPADGSRSRPRAPGSLGRPARIDPFSGSNLDGLVALRRWLGFETHGASIFTSFDAGTPHASGLALCERSRQELPPVGCLQEPVPASPPGAEGQWRR